MVRTIGRIILIVTGALLITSGVLFMINLSKNGFNFFDGATWSELALQIASMIVGLSALLSGLTNHCGFWLTIFVIITIIVLVCYLVSQINAHKFNGWTSIGQFCVTFALSLTYVLGFILMRIGKKRKK